MAGVACCFPGALCKGCKLIGKVSKKGLDFFRLADVACVRRWRSGDLESRGAQLEAYVIRGIRLGGSTGTLLEHPAAALALHCRWMPCGEFNVEGRTLDQLSVLCCVTSSLHASRSFHFFFLTISVDQQGGDAAFISSLTEIGCLVF